MIYLICRFVALVCLVKVLCVVEGLFTLSCVVRVAGTCVCVSLSVRVQFEGAQVFIMFTKSGHQPRVSSGASQGESGR